MSQVKKFDMQYNQFNLSSELTSVSDMHSVANLSSKVPNKESIS